jgi:transcriptional regulator with XRE-family HTH domain
MPRGFPRLRSPDKKQNLVGQRVKDRRTFLKLTQDALCARLAQVTNGEWNPGRRDIFRIEDGLRTVIDTEILALSESLECSSCWLLTGKQD